MQHDNHTKEGESTLREYRAQEGPERTRVPSHTRRPSDSTSSVYIRLLTVNMSALPSSVPAHKWNGENESYTREEMGDAVYEMNGGGEASAEVKAEGVAI